MYCVECGEALESILERMRKVCSVCYFGHRFRAEHRPVDLASGRPPDAEEKPDGSPSWGLASPGDRGHDSGRFVLHISQGDPKDDPAVRDLVEELTARIRAQRKHLEAGTLRTTEVFAQAARAVARARSIQDRTATLLARLESTWGISRRRAREMAADSLRREPTVLSAGPWSSPDPSDSSLACLSSMSEVGNPPR
jgi:predicted  nucleic acid-binding Zn-ribbon protein